jgi:lysophospholipase L1-like esterase
VEFDGLQSKLQSKYMAHPDPRVAAASRRMAHRVRFGRLRSARRTIAASPSDLFGTVPAGASTRFLARLVPEDQRRRDLGVVAALLLAAVAISASLPGGWANSASASPSGHVAAGDASMPGSPAAVDTIQPAGTVDVPAILPPPPVSPTLPPASAPTAAAAKTPRVYSFVALGDSLTAWPTSGPWPSHLDAIDANLRLVNNAGVPGDLTAEMLARCNTDVFAYNPEVLFILGGTNDVGTGVDQATTIAHLRSIVIGTRSRGIHIFLMKIPPTFLASDVGKIDSLNAAIVNLGNIYSVVVIDIHTPLSTSTGVIAPKYTNDGLHLNSLGVQVVVSAIYNRIHRQGY